MSLMLTAYLLEKYGPRLGMEEVAEVLRISKGNLTNRLYRGEITLPTYLDGGRRFCAAEDLAAYLGRLRETARAEG
jgi:hypothetical protein